MSIEDEEPTEEELVEAARLAAALEGKPRGEVSPDGLETASLLRFAGGAPALKDEERDAIIERAIAEARRPSAAPRSWLERLGWRPWLAFGALGAAAGAVFLALRTESAPTALPMPSADILKAQSAALAGADLGDLDQRMRGYRGDVYAVLEEHYRR